MKKLVIAAMTVSVFLTSCKENGGNKTNNETTTSQEVTKSSEKETQNSNDDSAICLIEKLSVRETPDPKGKWLTSMSLGEKIYLTGDETTEPKSNKVYVKVRLVDGKEGWAPVRFLAVGGKVGALLEDATVYKRPDLLTKTDKKYSAMDIIAVTDTQDDWVQVKGKRAEGEYVEEGWIKNSNISESDIDIATAKYAGLAMEKETMTDRIKALQEIVENSDLSSSTFINVLNDKIKDYQSRNTPIDAQDAKVEETAK